MIVIMMSQSAAKYHKPVTVSDISNTQKKMLNKNKCIKQKFC